MLKIIGQRSQRFELNAPRLAHGNRTENMEMNGTAPTQVSLVQLVQSKGPSQTAVVSLSARSELCKIRIPSYQEASCVENKFEFRPSIKKHLVWKTIFFSDQRDSLYCLKYICSNVAQPHGLVELVLGDRDLSFPTILPLIGRTIAAPCHYNFNIGTSAIGKTRVAPQTSKTTTALWVAVNSKNVPSSIKCQIINQKS